VLELLDSNTPTQPEWLWGKFGMLRPFGILRPFGMLRPIGQGCEGYLADGISYLFFFIIIPFNIYHIVYEYISLLRRSKAHLCIYYKGFVVASLFLPHSRSISIQLTCTNKSRHLGNKFPLGSLRDEDAYISLWS